MTKHKFKRVHFLNRWTALSYKPWKNDWVVFGFQKWYSGYASYRWTLCLFGLELSFWFEKKPIL